MRRHLHHAGSCRSGKVRWKDHSSAARAMKLIHAQSVTGRQLPIRVYQCPTCRGWHLTSEEG
jgi:hypothetical protein